MYYNYILPLVIINYIHKHHMSPNFLCTSYGLNQNQNIWYVI